MFGMTTPISILLISPMYNVMEMKQSLQTVIMSYHPLHIVIIIIIIIIMVLLLYYVKRVCLHENTNWCYCIYFVATIEAPVNCTEGEIRLYGGSKPNEGILHVCTNGAWGTVCLNPDWSENDAVVACRELGYSAYGLLHYKIIYKVVSYHMYFLQTIPMKIIGQMRSIPSLSLNLIVLVLKLDWVLVVRHLLHTFNIVLIIRL